MPNWDSKPSAVLARGMAMTPALLINMWSGLVVATYVAAKALIDPSELRSRGWKAIRSFPVSARNRTAAACPLTGSRPASTTRAPALARALAVSRPSPPAPPVTIVSFPVRS